MDGLYHDKGLGTIKLKQKIESLRQTARELSLGPGNVWHAESGVRGNKLTRPLNASKDILSANGNSSDLSAGGHQQDRYEFERPLLERGLRSFMKPLICPGSESKDVIAYTCRTSGFSFSAAAAGCQGATPAQETDLEGTGHSFIYGDHDEILRLGRKVALPAVRCLSEVSSHGWSGPNSCGDPLEALTDWVYIIYEVGLKTGDPELRRYYRFLVPFSAGECHSMSDDELRTFDGGSGVSRAEFGRPLLWKLLWEAAIRRELAFSKLGTDLVQASKTALDYLLDTDLASASSDAYAARTAAETEDDTSPRYAFECEGEFWHLTFEGETTHIRDGVGPRYIAVLLANPGREIFSPDIISLANGNPTVKVNHTRDLLADDAAMREYEKRLQELTEDLEEATELNDWGRQERLQQKLDDLKHEVLRLRGLKGKTRTFSGTFGNARTSVTNAINRTLRSEAVKDGLPNAYRHLDKAISRGIFMSYDPEKPIDWVLSTGKSAVLQAS